MVGTSAPRNMLHALLQRFSNDYALAQAYLQPLLH